MAVRSTRSTHPAVGVRSVGEVPDWTRELLDPALRTSVDGLPSTARHVVGYHFGWWEADGRGSSSGAGKRLRPALCLLAAAAAGEDARAALPAAVAVEHVHNFSLLHDDIIDGDARRRHRPTAWAVFARGPAVPAGDALLVAAFGELAGSRHQCTGDGLRALATRWSTSSPARISIWPSRDETTSAWTNACRWRAARAAALPGCACALGGMFAGAGADCVQRLDGFGMKFGLAFQLVDDLLGIWGDPAVTVKAVHADLSRCKKSLPVVTALGSNTQARASSRTCTGEGRLLDGRARVRPAAHRASRRARMGRGRGRGPARPRMRAAGCAELDRPAAAELHGARTAGDGA